MQISDLSSIRVNQTGYSAGMHLVQHGIYGDGSGEYNYLDAPQLKCIVELLESYR